MAFDQQSFTPVAGQSTNGPGLWAYKTNDLFAEVVSAGYFFAKRFQLEDGDLIYLATGNGAFLARYQDQDSPLKVLAPSEGELPDLEVYAVLDAQSLQDQEPDDVGIPYQISYGPALNGPDDPVMLSADGTLTVNHKGIYTFTTFLTVSRRVSTGNTLMFFRLLVNDQPQLNPIGLIIEDDEMTIPLSFDITRQLEPGTTIKIEMIRDSNGFNDGLVKSLLSADGWGNSASASMRVYGIRQAVT